MKKNIKIVQVLFAIPWLVFGIQHFMYADFVAGLVPEFMPLRLFWAYLTGTAMIAAGLSFIFDKAGWWAAVLLSAMLWLFILLIHIPALAGKSSAVDAWTRPLQDTALAAAALLLAGTFARSPAKDGLFERLLKASRFIFALMLIGFGVQQFFNLDFMTARIPAFFPLHLFWIYLTGSAMIATGIIVISIRKFAHSAALYLGFYLLIINTLNYTYLLANNLHEPILWTAAMLDLAITGGVFILAISSPAEE